MTEQVVRIRGLDTLLFRDGRPFSDEPGAFSARTLRSPLPGTIAGFLRTRIGNEKGWNKTGWNNGNVTDALKIEVAAPLLKLNDAFVFHAPADALIYKDEHDQDKPKVMCLRPWKDAPGGTNMPDGMLPMEVTDDVKPEPDYNFWQWDDLKNWLLSGSGIGFSVPKKIKGLPLEERVHVEISETGTSEEGKLFSAQFLSFEEHQWEQFKKKQTDRWSLVAKVTTDVNDLSGVGQLGGENRSAIVETVADNEWLPCPDDLKSAMSSESHVRMILATPAIFEHGWRPGWLDGNLIGTPAGISGCKLKLIAAAVKRREAVSGWDYFHKQPKPVRWMVPAGSVYFFEVQGNPGFPIEQAWLKPVSDNELDRKDGYGLALWGIWNYNKSGEPS